MRIYRLLGLAVALVTASPSLAVAVNFHLTGAHTADFVLPLSPTDIDPEGHADGLDDPTIFGLETGATVDGFSGPVLFHFYTADGGGGMDVISLGTVFFRFSPAGASVFTGTVFAPSFVPGEYDFIDYDFPSLTYHLTVSAVDGAALPEPAAWTMMIVGFGLVGGALRRRKSRVTICATR